MPDAQSRASTSATDRPRVAASSAAPAPVTPPPMTTTSNASLAGAKRLAVLAIEPRGGAAASSPAMHGTLPLCPRPSSLPSTRAPPRRAASCSTTMRAIVATDQVEHGQHLPQRGWVEHDANEIWANTRAVVAGALERAEMGAATSPPSGSPTSARRPSCGTAAPASRWPRRSSGRTPGRRRSATRSARPTSTASAPGCRSRRTSPARRCAGSWTTSSARRGPTGDLAFGTIDSWLLWNLTGGRRWSTPPTRRTRRARC